MKGCTETMNRILNLGYMNPMETPTSYTWSYKPCK